MTNGINFNFPFLKEMGLSDSEVAVYVSLLKIGGSHTNGTISKSAELKQSTTSNALSSLIRKGLISSINKNGHTYYFAEDPQKIMFLINEKARLLQKSVVEAKNVISELKAIHIEDTSKPKVRFFEGADAVKSIFLEMMEKSEDIYGYCSMYKEIDDSYEDFWNYYYSLVQNSNKKVQLIVPDSEEARAFKTKDAQQNREIKLVSEAEYFFPSEKHISGDFVAEITLQSEIPTVVLVEDRHIANSEKSFFKLAWNLINN